MRAFFLEILGFCQLKIIQTYCPCKDTEHHTIPEGVPLSKNVAQPSAAGAQQLSLLCPGYFGCWFEPAFYLR